MKKGSGFGVVVLLVVMAVVLVLVAKNWESIQKAAPAVQSGDPRALPGLTKMKSATDRHTAEVDDAIDERTSPDEDASAE